MAVIQMTKPEVVTQKDLVTEELHSTKVARRDRQSATVASFQTTFPEQLGVPSGADPKVDFALLKTYTAWNGGNGCTGLRYILTKGFVKYKRLMQAHMKVQLDRRPEALSLVSQTLLDVTHWFSWFVQELEEYYHNLSSKTCPGRVKKNASTKASCGQLL